MTSLDLGLIGLFLGPAAPQFDVMPRRDSLWIQVAAGRIDDVPSVELARPAVHLRGSYFGGITDQCGQNARFMDAGGPQLFGQAVVFANATRERVQIRRGDSESLGNLHAEIFHFGADSRIGEALELTQHAGTGPALYRRFSISARTFCRSRGGW